MNNKKSANVLAILIMIMWGLSYLSTKVVVNEVEPLLCAFYRFVISTIILFVILKVKYPEEKILKEDRFRLIFGAFLGVTLYFFFENYSIKYTSASNVSILLSAIPVFTLISQRIIFKEKLTLKKLAGAILSAIGIIIIIASKDKVSLFSKGTLGDLMAIAASVCWVAYNMVTCKFKGNYKSITITAYQSLWGCIFLSPSLFLSHITIPSVKVILNTVYLGVFCSCIAYVLYVYCLEHLGPTVLTTYINLQPIVSVVSAWILLSEKITIYQVAGSGIIIIGVFLVSYGNKFSMKKFKEMV
ncbi:MAG: DMT family transporter [Bacillota bacterium]|nr:DMT family transporter [Bacillota bacterium]